MTAPTQIPPCAKVDAWRNNPDAALIAHDFEVPGGWLAFARVADYAEWVRERDEQRDSNLRAGPTVGLAGKLEVVR